MPDYQIRPLQTQAELDACVALQKETWGQNFNELVPAALLRTVQWVGGVASGAFAPDGRLLGFVFGYSGVADGRLAHWSDMLAVRPELRGKGIGVALKWHQREVLLRLGVEVVYWTFDPLESRNAHVNLARLGAVAEQYHRDLYGQTDSPLHQGIGTDRLVALWPIASERVRRRLAGKEREPAVPEAASFPLVNPTRDEAGGLACAAPDLALAAPRLRLAIPADIQALKARDAALAADWRQKTRAAFEHYLEKGYRAVELVREAGGRSCYVLERRAFSS